MKKLHIVTLIMLGGFCFATVAGAKDLDKEKTVVHEKTEKKSEPQHVNSLATEKSHKEKKGVGSNKKGSRSDEPQNPAYNGIDTQKQPKKEMK